MDDKENLDLAASRVNAVVGLRAAKSPNHYNSQYKNALAALRYFAAFSRCVDQNLASDERRLPWPVVLRFDGS